MNCKKDFWAKTTPYQSVHTHGFICGTVAQMLFDQYLCKGTKELVCKSMNLSEEKARAFIGYLVSIHDIGKIEYNFQAKDPDVRKDLDGQQENMRIIFNNRVRHEKTGKRIAFDIWKDNDENEDSADLFSSIIGAHHQGKVGPAGNTKNNWWRHFQYEYEREMRELFFSDTYSGLPEPEFNKHGILGAVILGMMIISDWISSGPAFRESEEWIKDPDAIEKIKGIANNFIERSGLAPGSFKWPSRFCDVWKQISENSLRPLQKEIELVFAGKDKRISCLLVEAPMGEGKTEAGLYAAIRMAELWGKDGFYVAMPTAATANQMIGRIRDLLIQHNLDNKVRLMHSMAWLENLDSLKEDNGEESDGIANWLVPSRRGLLGQYAVGTIDQVMLAATAVKYGALRLLGLSNKVLIIDEIHSYDAYMSEIIVRLIEWCRTLEIPVVMLSATLPAEKKQELFVSPIR